MKILDYRGCLIHVHADGRIYADMLETWQQCRTVAEAKKIIDQYLTA